MPVIQPVNQDVQSRAGKIKLLLMDVDGVLTNGKLYHFSRCAGEDGRNQGLRFAGRDCAAVAAVERHQDLG